MLLRVLALINEYFKIFNLRLVKLANFNSLQEFKNNSSVEVRRELLKLLCQNSLLDYKELAKESKSQLGQDIFAISLLKAKRHGYFVEFGATNGVKLSNSYMLEKKYDWHGILVEPGRAWHSELSLNRTCHIDFRCVSRVSNKTIEFLESVNPEFSTTQGLQNSGGHSREIVKKYDVETISLNDLLEFYKAPLRLDFLSIDTEGSELEILKSFNFSKYKSAIIVCEHNFTSERSEIFELLSSHGYERVWSNYTQFDDWYVMPNLVEFNLT
jgi:FkbM family methyltransferase